MRTLSLFLADFFGCLDGECMIKHNLGNKFRVEAQKNINGTFYEMPAFTVFLN